MAVLVDGSVGGGEGVGGEGGRDEWAAWRSAQGHVGREEVSVDVGIKGFYQ